MDVSDLEGTPCPLCGVAALRVEERLRAKPVGSFSLAGGQMKVVAERVLWLVCGACGIEVEGRRV